MLYRYLLVVDNDFRSPPASVFLQVLSLSLSQTFLVSTIHSPNRHDPHAPPPGAATTQDQQHQPNAERAAALVRDATAGNGVVAANFSRQMFRGLKQRHSTTNEDGGNGGDSARADLSLEPMSSSEEEFVVVKKTKKRKKRRAKSSKKKAESASASSSASSSEEDKRNKKRRKRKKKKRKKRDYESEEASSESEGSARRKKRTKKRKKQRYRDGSSSVEEDPSPSEFIASNQFTGSRPGYVFHQGKRGLGYYRDKNVVTGTC